MNSFRHMASDDNNHNHNFGGALHFKEHFQPLKEAHEAIFLKMC